MLQTLDHKVSSMMSALTAGRVLEAERLAKSVLNIRPRHPKATFARGIIAWRRGETSRGLDLIIDACHGEPTNIDFVRAAARQAMEAQEYEKAEYFYKLGIAIEPGYQSNRDLGLALCGIRGRSLTGFNILERECFEDTRNIGFRTSIRPWTGEAARDLLILHEGGHGDLVQFMRWAPQNSILCAPKTMRRFVEHCGYRSDSRENPQSLHDAWCLLQSLPAILGHSIDDAEGKPYISTLPIPSGASPRRPTVGVVWGGSPLAPRDRLRSLSVEILGKLLAYDKVTWIVLQQGPHLNELKDLNPGPHVIVPPAGDFLTTAQYIAGLDLTLTVDTSIAHLSGAMGHPTWVMLPTVPDMRWPAWAGDRTPWYDSVRIFRQSIPATWPDVISRVHQALETL